jgi:hypothetical protein
MTSRTPLIVAIVLLLLPVLYVMSYLALVLPEGEVVLGAKADPRDPFSGRRSEVTHYRFGC